MRDIFLCYDTGVMPDEIEAIIEGLTEFVEIFPERTVYNYGSAAWCEGDYSSADWYVRKAKRISRGGRLVIDANNLASLLFDEPWQREQPHIDVLFTSEDLAARDVNWCFGLTLGACTVQSVVRYRGLTPEEKKLAIKAVVQHELGHVLRMAADINRAHTEMKLGVHCTSHGCIMRQGLNLDEWVRHAKQAKALHRIYCPLCLKDARTQVLF